MRAAPVGAARCLRVGVVRDGRMIDERLFKRQSRVIVGPGESADVVVDATDLPRAHVLFELSPGGWRFGAEAWMRGRVATHGDLVDLGGPTERIELDANARGKIVLGATILLFQLVAMPPVQPRPRLPMAVTRRALDVDPWTTFIAAFSFLIHFAFIGTLYSDWVDPVVDEGVEVSGLVEELHALPAPVDPGPEIANGRAPTAPAATAAPARSKPAARGASRGSHTAAQSSSRDAHLGDELGRVAMRTLAALGNTGPATTDILRDGEVATDTLDQAARRNVGVGAGDPLGVGRGTTRLRPGEAGSTLADIGVRRGATDQRTGQVQTTHVPKGNTSVPPPVVTGIVKNAASVVARLRPRFHACYRRALEENPDAQGRVQLVMRVAPNGNVQSASASASGNLPPSVAPCVQRAGMTAAFDAPEGGMAAVVVPISFLHGR